MGSGPPYGLSAGVRNAHSDSPTSEPPRKYVTHVWRDCAAPSCTHASQFDVANKLAVANTCSPSVRRRLATPPAVMYLVCLGWLVPIFAHGIVTAGGVASRRRTLGLQVLATASLFATSNWLAWVQEGAA
ncbi:MAG: hypothetical protein AAF721_13350, partial [Myxococcota bacterium]